MSKLMNPIVKDLALSEFAFFDRNKSSHAKKRAPSASPVKSSKAKNRPKHRKTRHKSPEDSESESKSDSEQSVVRARTKKTKSNSKRELSKKKPPPEPSPPPEHIDEESASGSVPIAKPKEKRYLSPPWIIDGEVIGDEVSVTADSRAKTPMAAPEISTLSSKQPTENLPARPEKAKTPKPDHQVLSLVGRWGLEVANTPSAKGSSMPQRTDAAEIGHRSRSRFFAHDVKNAPKLVCDTVAIAESVMDPLELVALDMERELLPEPAPNPDRYLPPGFRSPLPAHRSTASIKTRRSPSPLKISIADQDSKNNWDQIPLSHTKPVLGVGSVPAPTTVPWPCTSSRPPIPGFAGRNRFIHEPQPVMWHESGAPEPSRDDEARHVNPGSADRKREPVWRTELAALNPTIVYRPEEQQRIWDEWHPMPSLHGQVAEIDCRNLWHAQAQISDAIVGEGISACNDHQYMEEDSLYQYYAPGELQQDFAIEEDYCLNDEVNGSISDADNQRYRDDPYLGDSFAELDDSLEIHATRLQGHDARGYEMDESANQFCFVGPEEDTADDGPMLYQFNEGRELLLGLKQVERGEATVGEAFARDLWKR